VAPEGEAPGFVSRPEGTAGDDLAGTVRAAASGNEGAFASLVERFQGPVFALAYSYLRDADEAEEVSQEAFVRAYTALGRLERPESFPSWLNGITAHAAVDRMRERGRSEDPWEGLKEPEGPAEGLAGEERTELVAASIEAALSDLPEDCRRAALLRFFNDMTYSEIAELTSVPVSTVRGQLYRATRHLRERLKRLWTEA
jgi:RNA polymerase sigma-70 factor (ECF subfamily)